MRSEELREDFELSWRYKAELQKKTYYSPNTTPHPHPLHLFIHDSLSSNEVSKLAVCQSSGTWQKLEDVFLAAFAFSSNSPEEAGKVSFQEKKAGM